MYHDEVIAEVWKNREAYAKRHHHNLRKIVADLQKRQQKPFSRLVDRRKPKAGSRARSAAPPSKKK
ncbi:MAG: hypothetical protein AB1696_10020 [Planctomycetota bacterium]